MRVWPRLRRLAGAPPLPPTGSFNRCGLGLGRVRRRRLLAWFLIGLLAFSTLLIILGRLGSSNQVVFTVGVPGLTPADDAIVLHVENEIHVMDHVGGGTFRFVLSVEDLEKGRPVRYGYSRGGFQVFAEAGFLGNVGHRTFVPGETTEVLDVVEAWKWFPTEPLEPIQLDSRAGLIPIAPRQEFRAGPVLVDFWNPHWPLQYESTLERLQRVRYNWVELAPPWDYQSIDPPVISGTDVDVPAWPEDELRREIRAFKAGGLKVALEIQVCCTKVDFANRSTEWWTQWYDTYEAFVRFHADLALEEGVDAFGVGTGEGPMPGNREAPPFAEERWRHILDVARTSGAPISLHWYTPPPDDQPQPLWPPGADAFYADVDYVSVAVWDGLSDEEYPTMEQLERGVARVLRDLDYAYNQSQKPIVISQFAYASRNGSAQSKGAETFYEWGDPAAAPVRWDPRTQAMIYEAYLRGIASRSHVTGLFPFGYWYVDAPLTLDTSIRAKPAEELYSLWASMLSGNVQQP